MTPTERQERIALIQSRMLGGETLPDIARDLKIPYSTAWAYINPKKGKAAASPTAQDVPTEAVTEKPEIPNLLHVAVSEDPPPDDDVDKHVYSESPPEHRIIVDVSPLSQRLLDEIETKLATLRQQLGEGLTLTQYQQFAARTLNPHEQKAEALANYALGVASEAGELANRIKKHLYHGHALELPAVAEEVGDVLWYLAALATTLDRNLDEWAQANLTKLQARYPEGFDPIRSQQRKEG